jgi:DNA-directed RNA polymerase specialized sigma24 family protein
MEDEPSCDLSARVNIGESWPKHNLSTELDPDGAQQIEDRLDRNPDLWMYRGCTVGLLRKYLRLSLETGRLPSIVGREFFRAKITYYRSVTFEDRVIFVRDVEKCIGRLEYWDQQLIARVVLQEYNHGQAAYLLHCTRKTIQRRVPEVLDLLSDDFLKCKLLAAAPPRRRRSR